MHQKYAKDGLAILTVTLDGASSTDKERADERAKVEAFLEKLAPPFRTVNLDFDPKKAPATLNFNGVPGAFVFNREGQHVLKLPTLNDKGEEVLAFDDDGYNRIEKAASEALKKK